MLSRKNSLTKKSDFARILSSNNTVRTKLISFYWTERNTPDKKFGVIVSSKKAKSAVERNKLRRRIKSAIFYFLPFLKQGIKCVLIVNNSNISFSDAKTTIGSVFVKAGLLNKNEKNYKKNSMV